MSLNRRLFRCRKPEDKFPTLNKKSKCRTCDREVSKIRHDGRRIFGQNVVVFEWDDEEESYSDDNVIYVEDDDSLCESICLENEMPTPPRFNIIDGRV